METFTSVSSLMLLLVASEGKGILIIEALSTSFLAKGEGSSEIWMFLIVFENECIWEPFWFEINLCFAFFSWAFLHRTSFLLSISSLHTLMQATLRSLLNSWTGFKKASSDDNKTCEVFSVCNLNPTGTSIPAILLVILVFKLDWDVTGQMWREICLKNANAREVGQRDSAFSVRSNFRLLDFRPDNGLTNLCFTDLRNFQEGERTGKAGLKTWQHTKSAYTNIWLLPASICLIDLIVMTTRRKVSRAHSSHLSLEEGRHRLPCRPIAPFLLDGYLKNPQWHYPVKCLILTRYPKDYEKGHRHGESQHPPQPIVLEVCLLIPVQWEMTNPKNQEHMARKKNCWIMISSQYLSKDLQFAP